MNRMRVGLVFIVIMAIMGAYVDVALAGRGCNAGATGPASFVVADSKAPGKTYDGTVTFYYEVIPDTDLVNMFYFARIIVDKDTIVPFAGVEYLVDWWDYPGQQAAMKGFLEETVVPRLFEFHNPGMVCNPGLDCPPVAVKSVTDGVEDNQLSSELFFLILDITIAVDY